MDTSELLRTPLNVFFLALTLVLAFLAAQRIGNKRLRIPIRVTCSVATVLSGLLLAWMLFGRGKSNETIVEVKNGPFKALVRSQEFHHSGLINVDVCIADNSEHAFPENEREQCFLHGFDFSGLSVNWRSGKEIEVSYRSGRVTWFTNYASLSLNGSVPAEFHTILCDACEAGLPQ